MNCKVMIDCDIHGRDHHEVSTVSVSQYVLVLIVYHEHLYFFRNTIIAQKKNILLQCQVSTSHVSF